MYEVLSECISFVTIIFSLHPFHEQLVCEESDLLVPSHPKKKIY